MLPFSLSCYWYWSCCLETFCDKTVSMTLESGQPALEPSPATHYSSSQNPVSPVLLSCKVGKMRPLLLGSRGYRQITRWLLAFPLAESMLLLRPEQLLRAPFRLS